jgi:hypothetical protein
VCSMNPNPHPRPLSLLRRARRSVASSGSACPVSLLASLCKAAQSNSDRLQPPLQSAAQSPQPPSPNHHHLLNHIQNP